MASLEGNLGRVLSIVTSTNESAKLLALGEMASNLGMLAAELGETLKACSANWPNCNSEGLELTSYCPGHFLRQLEWTFAPWFPMEGSFEMRDLLCALVGGKQ